MNSVVERATEIVKPVVENMGYEIVEIDYSKSYGVNELTIYIFKKGGISIEDCEKVNNALDSVLESNDITEGVAYNLNISSPGLDRLIKTDDDYRRNLDTEIEILFKVPLGKKKKINGVLVSYDKNTITILVKGKEVKLNNNNCDVVRPYIKF